jgi:hypothetical protein
MAVSHLQGSTTAVGAASRIELGVRLITPSYRPLERFNNSRNVPVQG